ILLNRPLTVAPTDPDKPTFLYLSGAGRVKWRWTAFSSLGTPIANRESVHIASSDVTLEGAYGFAAPSPRAIIRCTGTLTASFEQCTFLNPANGGTNSDMFAASSGMHLTLNDVVGIAAGFGFTGAMDVDGSLVADGLRLSGFDNSSIIRV